VGVSGSSAGGLAGCCCVATGHRTGDRWAGTTGRGAAAEPSGSAVKRKDQQRRSGLPASCCGLSVLAQLAAPSAVEQLAWPLTKTLHSPPFMMVVLPINTHGPPLRWALRVAMLPELVADCGAAVPPCTTDSVAARPFSRELGSSANLSVMLRHDVAPKVTIA